MPVASQKWLDNLWLIWLFDSHLSTNGNLFLVVVDVSCFWCSLLINVWRLRIAPSCVAVGQLTSQ